MYVCMSRIYQSSDISRPPNVESVVRARRNQIERTRQKVDTGRKRGTATVGLFLGRYICIMLNALIPPTHTLSLPSTKKVCVGRAYLIGHCGDHLHDRSISIYFYRLSSLISVTIFCNISFFLEYVFCRYKEVANKWKCRWKTTAVCICFFKSCYM